MKKYLSTLEVAEMYGVTKQAVGLWVKDGLKYKIEKIPGIKTRRVFDPEEVVAFLKIGIRD